MICIRNLFAIVLLVCGSAITFAQQAGTPPPASPRPPDAATLMQQRMEEMQSHWEKMNQTQDPAERQKLMLEHRQRMQELMAELRKQSAAGTPGGPGRQGEGPGGMPGGPGMANCPMMPGGGPGTGGGCLMMHGGGPGPGGGCPMMQGGGPGAVESCPMMHRGRGMVPGGQGMPPPPPLHQEVLKRLDRIQMLLEQLLQRETD